MMLICRCQYIGETRTQLKKERILHCNTRGTTDPRCIPLRYKQTCWRGQILQGANSSRTQYWLNYCSWTRCTGLSGRRSSLCILSWRSCQSRSSTCRVDRGCRSQVRSCRTQTTSMYPMGRQCTWKMSSDPIRCCNCLASMKSNQSDQKHQV